VSPLRAGLLTVQKPTRAQWFHRDALPHLSIPWHRNSRFEIDNEIHSKAAKGTWN